MRTKPTLRNIAHYASEFFIVSIFYGAVIFGGGSIFILGKMGLLQELPQRQLLVLATVSLTSIGYLTWRYNQYRKMEIWELSEGYLHRGCPRNLSLDLSTIEKAISGLPKSRWHGDSSRYSCTLILKMNEYNYLPLYLFNFGGGLNMMNEIAKILSDKTDQNYVFNQAERKALKPRVHNKVVQL